VLIDALHPALEDREIILKGIGVAIAALPFFLAVVNAFVVGEFLTDRGIIGRLVGSSAV
jgi:hypothetical protein